MPRIRVNNSIPPVRRGSGPDVEGPASPAKSQGPVLSDQDRALFIAEMWRMVKQQRDPVATEIAGEANGADELVTIEHAPIVDFGALVDLMNGYAERTKAAGVNGDDAPIGRLPEIPVRESLEQVIYDVMPRWTFDEWVIAHYTSKEMG